MATIMKYAQRNPKNASFAESHSHFLSLQFIMSSVEIKHTNVIFAKVGLNSMTKLPMYRVVPVLLISKRKRMQKRQSREKN